MNTHKKQVRYLQAPTSCGFADEDGLPTNATAILPCVSDVSSDDDSEAPRILLDQNDDNPEINEAVRELDIHHHQHEQQLAHNSGFAAWNNPAVAHFQETGTGDEPLDYCLFDPLQFLHDEQQDDIHEALRALDTLPADDSSFTNTHNPTLALLQAPYPNQANSAVIINEQNKEQVKQMAFQANIGNEALDCLLDPLGPLPFNHEEEVNFHEINEALRALDTDLYNGNQPNQQRVLHSGLAITTNPDVPRFQTPYPDQVKSAAIGIERNPDLKYGQMATQANTKNRCNQDQAPRPHAPPTVIRTLTKFDIARGRPGNLAKNHTANRYFLRPFLRRYSLEYSRLRGGGKRALARKMLHKLKSDGYRFVIKRKGLGGWIEIQDEEKKVDQIMHALRDGIRKRFLPAIE
ncbi:MAG: hypothetical protein SGBAC_011278 [Bacillariaceae sp.]